MPNVTAKAVAAQAYSGEAVGGAVLSGAAALAQLLRAMPAWPARESETGGGFVTDRAPGFGMLGVTRLGEPWFRLGGPG